MSTDAKRIYGIDISMFPGQPALDWLRKNAEIRFACFYLGPTDNHGDRSWMDRRSELAVAGWGLIPTYVGQQAHVKRAGAVVPNPNLTAARGKRDGNQACDMMVTAGFALGSVLYLDLEEGDEPSGAYQTYVLSWLDAVTKRSFVAAIYCPGGASRWALEYARIVWLAAPDNVDDQGKVVPAILDPKNLPSPPLKKGFVACQFKWEIEFNGLSQPSDGDHGPRFDLNLGLVADPSDFAAVDRALLDQKDSGETMAADDILSTARAAFDQFVKFREVEARIDGGAAAPPSPTSDPRCGPPSEAADRIMPDEKIALNLAEAMLAIEWVSQTIDTGLSEEDFDQMTSATPAATKPDRWAEVTWPARDADSPDYHHLASSLTLPIPANGVAPLSDFELKPEDVELVLGANRMTPIGFDDVVALAIRGARLGRLNEVAPPVEIEDAVSAWITETRPDHKNFRCLIGFYSRSAEIGTRKLTLFSASTVPNAEYVESWYQFANRKTASGVGNMMPTGCYVYRVGVHNSPHAGEIKPALRLTDTSNLHIDGTATVLRTRNDKSYDVGDIWCKTIPADNVHCSFQTASVPGWGAPFSSAGCMTIRGKQDPTDQWKKAQAILNRLGQGKRCDLVLITGRDLAIAAELRAKNLANDAATVRRELWRLRPGSRGEEVGRLQDKLGLERTSYFGSVLKKALVDEQARRGLPIDGIFSPKLDAAWQWNVLADGRPS